MGEGMASCEGGGQEERQRGSSRITFFFDYLIKYFFVDVEKEPNA